MRVGINYSGNQPLNNLHFSALLLKQFLVYKTIKLREPPAIILSKLFNDLFWFLFYPTTMLKLWLIILTCVWVRKVSFNNIWYSLQGILKAKNKHRKATSTFKFLSVMYVSRVKQDLYLLWLVCNRHHLCFCFHFIGNTDAFVLNTTWSSSHQTRRRAGKIFCLYEFLRLFEWEESKETTINTDKLQIY